MKRDLVFFDQTAEILRGVARQGRFREMRIVRKKIFRGGAEVGEIAAAAAGDADLFTDGFIVLEDNDRTSALTSLDRAHQTRGAGADHDDIFINTDVLIHKI